MKEPDCGGCKGQGAHSRRCRTNPGWFWYRLQDMAEDLGDNIGSNDVTAANLAYAIADRMKDKAEERQCKHGYGIEQGPCPTCDSAGDIRRGGSP